MKRLHFVIITTDKNANIHTHDILGGITDTMFCVGKNTYLSFFFFHTFILISVKNTNIVF